MTRDELLHLLEEYRKDHVKYDDPSEAHRRADAALLVYIHDEAVTAAFEAIPREYY